MNRLEQYREFAYGDDCRDIRARTAIKDLLDRLEIAEQALKQCHCVSTADEGTAFFPAQEALAKIKE